MTCIICEIEFTYHPKKRGKISECPGCATDIPHLTAEMGSDDTGVVESVNLNEDFYREHLGRIF